MHSLLVTQTLKYNLFARCEEGLPGTFWEKMAINPARTQLINPLTHQYFWLQGSWTTSPLSPIWPLLQVPQLSSFQADSNPRCKTNAKLFVSRARGMTKISKMSYWTWGPIDQCLERQGLKGSKNHNTEAGKILLNMEDDVKRLRTSTST